MSDDDDSDHSTDHLASDDEEGEDECEEVPSSPEKKKGKRTRKQWKNSSEQAQTLAKTVVAGDCDPNDFSDFRRAVPETKDWVADNLWGPNSLDTLRRHFKSLVKQAHEHCLTGNGASLLRLSNLVQSTN